MTNNVNTSHHARSSLTRRAFVAGGSAAAFALAGCSGGAQQSSPAGAGSPAQGSASPAAADANGLTQLTFCLDYTPNTNHTGIYVAQALGYFADEGLEVSIVQPAEDSAEAIIGTGQAQLGISYQDYLANVLALADPMPIAAVAAVVQHNTSGIMSLTSSGITRPAALEGHRYTTWELPVEQATMKQVVEKDGGDWSKVTLVPYATDDDVAGLLADLYDAVWVYEGWAVQSAKIQGVDYNYFSFISVDDTFDYYTPVIAANTDFAAAHPEVVSAFLRAAKKGYEFCVEDPDEAARILCEQVPELDAELVGESQTYLAGQYVADASSWGEIDPERWQRFYQWLNDNQLTEIPLDPASGFDMSYLGA